MTDKKINWQPISMISVFVEMINEMLESAEIQLNQLRQAKDKPHVLDDEIINRILKSYNEQNELIPVYLQQCQRWLEEELNDKQQAWVTEIKDNATSLLLINKEIIDTANSISDKTIDKILKKSDAEVALNLFQDK